MMVVRMDKIHSQDFENLFCLKTSLKNSFGNSLLRLEWV